MRTETGTELLLKAETEQAMQHWVQVSVILEMILIYRILICSLKICDIKNIIECISYLVRSSVI